jgi:hypothetical protein
MTRRRVAIIGGGIAGLTCLRELLRAGIDVRLFEKEERIGGRVFTLAAGDATVELGAGYFHEHYTAFARLVRELGLEVVPRRKQGHVSLALDDRLLELSTWRLLVELAKGELRVGELNGLLRLRRFVLDGCRRGAAAVASLDRAPDRSDVLAVDPQLAAMQRASFADIRAWLPERWWHDLIAPICRKQLCQEPESLSLLVGMAVLGSGHVPLLGLRGGIGTLTRRLHVLHRDAIELGRPVTSLPDADFVVCAAPPPVARLIDGIPAEAIPAVDYAEGKVLVVRGRLKRRFAHAPSIFVADPELGIDGISAYGDDLFKLGVRERPALDRFFSDWSVVREQRWAHAIPRCPPGTSFSSPPARQLGGTRLFFAGDSFFPSLEAAVVSGRKVAREIARRIEAGPRADELGASLAAREAALAGM